MKSADRIENFMTFSPHTINSGMPIETAQAMMKKFGVRHLPVQVAGHLVGVVTERDLFLARSLDKEGKLMVDDVMTPEPYAVPSEAPLGDVVEEMATRRYGCAVVCNEQGRVIGIFTAVDGLRAIGDKLNTKARKAEFAKGFSK
jgi:CBS domain-containing protein